MGHDGSEKCPICGALLEELDRKTASLEADKARLEREVNRYQRLHASESDY